MKDCGIQLYSVRDVMGQDMNGTLQKIADMGYKYVEFAGFFGHSAEEVKQMLADTGLVCSSAHSPWTDLRPSKIMETIAYHKTIGNPYYIIPGASLDTLEKIEEFCNVVNFAQPILAAEGIKLAYHNHSREFVVMPWGSTIWSELERRTNINFEIDVFWASVAGLDLFTTLDRYKHRMSILHIKDGFPKESKGTTLGLGEVPISDVVAYACKNGMTMVVESETLNPSGLAEAEACIDYLKSID